ncbi:MAG: DUF192 domain-containing protein [Rhodospirillaceae bacterium]|nr:DUF192 domain-containing protein [Rhodospirillaceae bacterium]
MANVNVWKVCAAVFGASLALSSCEKAAPSAPPQSAVAAASPVEDPAPHEPLDPKKAQSLPEAPLTIAGHSFTVELADDDQEREIGLMHRGRMADDHGMLFDFMTPRRVGFWMRNTFIPLDMLFVKSDGEIVAIMENIRPHVETPVGPDRPVRAVLELNGGIVKKLGLKVGDVVHHGAFKNLP